MTKNKFLGILIFIFAFLFMIFPTSYGIMDLKITIIFFFFLFVFFIIIKKIKLKIKINEKFYPIIIVFLAFISRVLVVLIFNDYITQVSNFGDAFERAIDLDFSGRFYMIFSHWTLYPAMLHLVFKIFGSSQIVALLVNCVLLTIIAFLIYKIASLLISKKAGFFSSILYIIWPSNILYTLIVNPENFGIILLLTSLYLFIYIEKNEDKFKNKLKKIISFILIGFLLGFSTFFKNFALVFIIAFFIFLFLKYFKIKKDFKKYFLNSLLAIIIICFSFSITNKVGFLIVDNIVGNKVARNIIPGFLNIGLRGDGTLSENRWIIYYDILEKNNYNFDKANDVMMNGLINDLKNKNSDMRQKGFFDNKANILFRGDHGKIDWVIESLRPGQHNNVINLIEKYVLPINNIFYTIIITLMGMGVLFLVKSKNLEVLLLYIIIFGVSLMLLIAEAQNRYMYSIQTLMCILSIYSFINIKKLKKN